MMREKRTNVITSIFNHAFLIIFRADRLRTSFPKHSCPTYFSHFRKMYMVLLDTLKSRKIFISRHVILTSTKKKNDSN